MENVYIKLYDPADTYMSPAGTIMDEAAVLEHFPAVQRFSYIVQTDEGGEVMYGFYSLSSMKSKYGIPKNMSDVDAAQAIEDAMNAEQLAQDEAARNNISPEERIAAALEFQVMSSLPDVE